MTEPAPAAPVAKNRSQRWFAAVPIAALLPFAALLPSPAADAQSAQDKPAETRPDWGPPTAPFTAEMVFRDGRGQERRATLSYTRERQRLEYVAGRSPVALLVHEADGEAKGKSWLLLLNRREYYPLPHKPVDFFLGVSQPKAKRTVLGREPLLGREVTKMEVTGETRTGDRFVGQAWATDERIVVRLRGTVTRGEKSQQIEMDVTRLEVGPVEPSLLALPPNYKAVDPPKRR